MASFSIPSYRFPKVCCAYNFIRQLECNTFLSLRCHLILNDASASCSCVTITPCAHLLTYYSPLFLSPSLPWSQPYGPRTWVSAAAAYARRHYELHFFRSYECYGEGEEDCHLLSLHPSCCVSLAGWDLSHLYQRSWLGGRHPRFAEAILLRWNIHWSWCCVLSTRCWFFVRILVWRIGNLSV